MAFIIKGEDYLEHYGRKGMKWYEHLFGDLDPRGKYFKSTIAPHYKNAKINRYSEELEKLEAKEGKLAQKEKDVDKILQKERTVRKKLALMTISNVDDISEYALANEYRGYNDKTHTIWTTEQTESAVSDKLDKKFYKEVLQDDTKFAEFMKAYNSVSKEEVTPKDILDAELTNPDTRARIEQYMHMNNDELIKVLDKATRGKYKELPKGVEVLPGKPVATQRVAAALGAMAGPLVGIGAALANPAGVIAAGPLWGAGFLGSFFGGFFGMGALARELTVGGRVREENKKRKENG